VTKDINKRKKLDLNIQLFVVGTNEIDFFRKKRWEKKKVIHVKDHYLTCSLSDSSCGMRAGSMNNGPANISELEETK
jgi:hypothetical protein